MTPRVLFALALALAAAQGCERSRTPTTPEPPAPPRPEHDLVIVRTSGVNGSPAAGTVRRVQGDTVQYAFTAAAGFTDLEVLLDTVALPHAGSFVVDTARVLRVTAWPSAALPAGALGTAVSRIYTEGSPDALRQVMARVADATLDGDAAVLEEIRRAEYAALLATGPAGLQRALAGLAGQTVPLAGEAEGASSMLAAPLRPDALFAQDTVVPTTIIFVNGIFNTRTTATSGAEALLRLVQEAGFDRASLSRTAGGARPGSAIQVYLHFNPIVSFQSPFESCTLQAAWAMNVATLAEPGADEASLLARAWGAVRRQATTLGSCAVFFSTNARVLQQFLDANLGSLSRPDVQDAQLVSLVRAERARGGGRNVLVVGHSHGSMIARIAVGAGGARGEHRGCLGAIALGSPLSTTVDWPNQQSLTRIIGRGQEDLSHDILYPLGPGRTDGRPSEQTARFDAALRQGGVGLVPIVLRQLHLHGLEGAYFAADGLGAQVVAAVRGGYAALGDACGGAFTGEVRDFETGEPISGARVTLWMGARERGNTTTTGAGRFTTPRVRPLLHEVVVAAEGYQSDTLRQRLVSFDATLPVQEGPIFLGKECPRDASGACDLSGVYTGYYHLSGARVGIPVACSFHSTLHLVQTGGTVQGTVSTDRYQRGCDAGSHYIHWGQGAWQVSGTVAGDRLVLQHPAIPPWVLAGRAYRGGFHVTEPTWLPGDFRLRVEITARRTGDLLRDESTPPPTPDGAALPISAGSR